MRSEMRLRRHAQQFSPHPDAYHCSVQSNTKPQPASIAAATHVLSAKRPQSVTLTYLAPMIRELLVLGVRRNPLSRLGAAMRHTDWRAETPCKEVKNQWSGATLTVTPINRPALP
jgi:hypothetical protein